MATEQVLRDWRYGQTQAERLTAGLLYVEGYTRIDPQHPLGGPDGRKDVLFEYRGKRWLAAAYFPPTNVTIREIAEKFAHDSAGVVTNNCHGIAFFVNKHLTISERGNLMDSAKPIEAEIFHLERMRAMLDSPRACGLRLEYLQIPMSEEEQWAFWQAMNANVMETLVESEKRLRLMDSKLDKILARTQSLEFGLIEAKSSLEVIRVNSAYADNETTEPLTIKGLLRMHRLLTENISRSELIRGRFRSLQVWVGGARPDTSRYVPPPADEVPMRVANLLDRWTQAQSELIGATRDEIVVAIAKFHHEFLSIHPFLDANGRVARAIADESAHELLGMRVSDEIIRDRESYFKALEHADKGDLEPLIRLFQAAVSKE